MNGLPVRARIPGVKARLAGIQVPGKKKEFEPNDRVRLLTAPGGGRQVIKLEEA